MVRVSLSPTSVDFGCLVDLGNSVLNHRPNSGVDSRERKRISGADNGDCGRAGRECEENIGSNVLC